MNDPNRNGTWQEGIFAQYKPKYICDTCEKYPCSEDKTKLMLSCPAYSPKPKTVTHGDSIRTMTDEELAEFLNHGACPPGEDVTERCSDEDGGAVPDMCYLCWLDWLKEEAKP